MGFLQFEGVGVSGMSACVPRRIIHNYEYTEFFSQAEVKEVVDKIGIVERRFVDDKTCSSDLCFAAAERLISDMNIYFSDSGLSYASHFSNIAGTFRIVA